MQLIAQHVLGEALGTLVSSQKTQAHPLTLKPRTVLGTDMTP